MPDDRAIHLETIEEDDQVTIKVLGNSPHTQHVSFTIEVSGSSRSKHSSSTTLAADDPQTLSTLKVSTNGDWCAKLLVEEEGRAPYELIEGPCAD